MTEQDLKEPGKLHLLALAQNVINKEYVEKQMPKPCYRMVAADILAAYKQEKSWKRRWMALAIAQAFVQIAMMIGG